MGLATSIGRSTLGIATEAGGMAMVLARALRTLAPPRVDRQELLRSFRSFGELSLPIVIATASFTGMIMVLQGAVIVEQFGIYNMVGWYTGFATFREVGPMLIGLMFSGRVGANNTSELATMRVTEQLDALRILAIDPYEALILPRLISMVGSLTCLVVFADLVALLAGGVCARLLIGVDYTLFITSMLDGLRPSDFLMGVAKAVAFGVMIGTVSTHFGLTAKGGSTGVGRAVNAQVVGSAVALFVMDYLITAALR